MRSLPESASMTPHLQIRRAGQDDIPALCALGARTFRETYLENSDPDEVEEYADTAFTPDKVGLWLAHPRATTLLVVDDGEPVGYALVLRDAVPECVGDPEAAMLSRLYLAREAQGLGLGKLLMHAALEAAAALGARTVWLGVYERNPRAIAFYESWGFERVGTYAFEMAGVTYQDPVMACALDRAQAAR